MNPPTLTIIAGSNGSGKSTLTAWAREVFQDEPLLDPDAFAKSTHLASTGEESPITSGRQVLLRATELLRAQQSFSVETTLSGSTYLKMAANAKLEGYQVVAIFVGTDDISINIARIRDRVEKGGHDVPESDQRRRYPRTLANLKRLLSYADVVILFDNSTEKGFDLVAFGTGANLHWSESVPAWATSLLNQ